MISNCYAVLTFLINLPDHELVVAAGRGVLGVSSSEEIVSNIGTDVSAAVRPRSRGLHVADATEEALGVELER